MFNFLQNAQPSSFFVFAAKMNEILAEFQKLQTPDSDTSNAGAPPVLQYNPKIQDAILHFATLATKNPAIVMEYFTKSPTFPELTLLHNFLEWV